MPSVVRCGTVGVVEGEVSSGHHVGDDLLAADLGCGDDAASAAQAKVCLVREDAQQRAAARDLGELGGKRLGHGVDRVGAHRVTHVHDEVHDHMGATTAVDDAHDEVASAAADLDEARVLRVRELEQAFALLEDAQLGRVRVCDVEQLDLRLHEGQRRRREESAGRAGHAGDVACRSDDRGLLGGHGHEHLATVDDEVGGDADRNRDLADRVLDHAVCPLDVEAARSQGVCLVREAGNLLDDLLQSILRRLVPKTTESGGCSHVAPFIASLRNGEQSTNFTHGSLWPYRTHLQR